MLQDPTEKMPAVQMGKGSKVLLVVFRILGEIKLLIPSTTSMTASITSGPHNPNRRLPHRPTDYQPRSQALSTWIWPLGWVGDLALGVGWGCGMYTSFQTNI